MAMIFILPFSVIMIMLCVIFIMHALYQKHLQRKAEKGKLTKDEWKVYRGPSFF